MASNIRHPHPSTHQDIKTDPADFHTALWDQTHLRDWKDLVALEHASTASLSSATYLSASSDIAQVIISRHATNGPKSSDFVPPHVVSSEGLQVPLNARRILRHFIRVLETQNYPPIKDHLQNLEKLIILHYPSPQVRGRRASTGTILRKFVPYIQDTFNKHMVLKTLAKFDRSLSKTFGEPSLKEEWLFSKPNPTYGQSYRDYMTFVKRSQHLIAEGFKDRELISVLQATGHGSEHVNVKVMEKSSKTIFKDRLLHSPTVLDRLKLSRRRPKSIIKLLDRLYELPGYARDPMPLQDWDHTHVDAIGEALDEHHHLVSSKHIKLLDQFNQIAAGSSSSQLKPPPNRESTTNLPVEFSQSSDIYAFYQRFEHTDGGRFMLDRISKTLEAGMEAHRELGDQASELFIEIVHHFFANGVKSKKADEQTETFLQNAIMFSLLSHSLGDILEDAIAKAFPDLTSRPKVTRSQCVRYYWWILIRQPSNYNRLPGGVFITLAQRSKHELGESYRRYLNAACQFEDMLKRPNHYLAQPSERGVRVTSEGSQVPIHDISSLEAHTQPSRAKEVSPTETSKESDWAGPSTQNNPNLVTGAKRVAADILGFPTLETYAHHLHRNGFSRNLNPSLSQKMPIVQTLVPSQPTVPTRDRDFSKELEATERVRKRLRLDQSISIYPSRAANTELTNVRASSQAAASLEQPMAARAITVVDPYGNHLPLQYPSWPMPLNNYRFGPGPSHTAINNKGNNPGSEALAWLIAQSSDYFANSRPISSAFGHASDPLAKSKGRSPSEAATLAPTSQVLYPYSRPPILNQVNLVPWTFNSHYIAVQRSAAESLVRPHRDAAVTASAASSSSNHRVLRLFGQDIRTSQKVNSEQVLNQHPDR